MGITDADLIREMEGLVRQAGKQLLGARPGDSMIHQKEGIANFCTDYDVRIQRFLIGGLQKLLPEASFFGEEDTEGNDGGPRGSEIFYIDPIDGTTNFMFGYHHSCVSLGLAREGRMAVGMVYNPYAEELYLGVRGQGSFLNGRRLQIPDLPLSRGIVAFGCARYNEGDTDLLFDLVKELYLDSLSVRNGGSAALDLCRVASGSNVLYLELKLQPYDYAAASLILEEAGGRITTAEGGPVSLDGPCSVLAGTPRAHEEAGYLYDALRKKR